MAVFPGLAWLAFCHLDSNPGDDLISRRIGVVKLDHRDDLDGSQNIRDFADEWTLVSGVVFNHSWGARFRGGISAAS